MLWLGLAARSFYQQQLGYLMAASPNWFAAILFYLLFVAGLLGFVVLPGLRDNSLKSTLLHAALFGLIAYATYDLTNLATLKGWPALLSLVDMLWGTVIERFGKLHQLYGRQAAYNAIIIINLFAEKEKIICQSSIT